MTFSDRDRLDCREGERLIELAMRESNPHAYDRFLSQAAHILSPLVEKKMPDALYLYACYLLGREKLTDEENDTKHVRLVEAAAVQGHARAQFAMGQFHDRGGDLLPYDAKKSAEWFRLSAEQGYPYAQWVHGMNLLHGLGVPADERLALDFIKQAAEGKFEEALKYMADVYAEGRHGFPVDMQQAEYWREKLQEPGVTGL